MVMAAAAPKQHVVDTNIKHVGQRGLVPLPGVVAPSPLDAGRAPLPQAVVLANPCGKAGAV